MHSATSSAHDPTTSVTTMFAPAELDWFRHTPPRKDAPTLLAITDARRPGAPQREWWRGLLEDLG